MKNRKLKAILRRHGFIEVRSRGDHKIWRHPEHPEKHIVLYDDDGTEVPEWLLKRAMKLIEP